MIEIFLKQNVVLTGSINLLLLALNDFPLVTNGGF